MKDGKSRCMVVKIGSNTITSGEDNLDKVLLARLANQVKELIDEGWKVVIVSSGAVALGRPRMRSCNIDDILCKQRAAARGQPLLMAGWREVFQPFEIEADQLLFNKNNFAAHMKVLKVIDDGVVIANGDDTGNEPGVEEEIIYGDNDDLAADIAIDLEADVLVYLTDVEGILDENGKRVDVVDPDEDLSVRGVEFNGKNDKGTGGIRSKHKFASAAAKKGVRVVIVKGKDEDVLLRIVRGENAGTRYIR